MSTIEVTEANNRSARIKLNRPERLNALSPELLRDLITVCDGLARDTSIRVVALEGAGDAFSAGADLPEFSKELASAPHAAADLGRVAMEAVAGLPQISVAIIQGHCIGGGIVLAAACDVRICSGDSRFRIPELEAGIPLGWGGMAHLVRLVGETVATDLVLTGRPFDAEDAFRVGFVSRVVPAEDLAGEAGSIIDSIALKAHHPLLVTKQQLRAIRSGSFDPTGDAEALLQSFTDREAAESLRTYTNRLR